MRQRPFRLAGCAAVLLAGCSGPQSAIDPAGPVAGAIQRLGVFMYVVAAAVTVLVTVLMLVPFLRRRGGRAPRKLFLWGGGVGLPFLTLVFLVPYVFTVGRDLRRSGDPDRLAVDVTGNRYWWEVRYRIGTDSTGIASANEIRVPVGERVEIFLRSSDVVHSLWVPRLAGKTDLTPGRVAHMAIQADEAGTYRGQCAEFCGLQHARMALEVIAVPRAEFDAWLDRLALPAAEPETAELRRGREVFLRAGCSACHTIRNVSAGQTGPDLTHAGSRRTIAAGTLPSNVGTIAGWIASAQHIKPGNAMPSFNQLTGEQLRLLASYIASLK